MKRIIAVIYAKGTKDAKQIEKDLRFFIAD